MIVGLLLIGLGCFGIGFSLRGIINHTVGKKEPENAPLVRDISLEELSALLKSSLKKNLLMNWL